MFQRTMNFVFPVLLCVGITGCANGPKATQADIPLVNSSLAYSLAPSKDQAINIPNANRFHQTNEPFVFLFDGIEYVSHKAYISATGNKCIRFTAQNNSTVHLTDEKITSCLRDGQWKVITPLVTSEIADGE